MSMIRSVTVKEASAFPFSGERDTLTFQKMQRIMTMSDVLLLSDGQNVLFARAGLVYPAWIYTKRGCPDETLTELAASLCVLKEAKNLKGVVGRPSLVRYLELCMPFPSKRRIPLTSYLCAEPHRFSADGERVPAKNLDPAVCGALLAQLGEQAREPIPEEERLAAGERFCANPGAYGWCINGTTVSLAAVTDHDGGVAHIGQVVTDAAYRGHGYAKALVSSVCADECRNGMRTHLYADTSYKSSNALYRAVGFVETGRLIGSDFQ